MKKKVNIRGNMRFTLGIFVALFVLLGTYLLYTTVAHGEEWFSSPYNPRISASRNIEHAGSIYDRNGVRLAWSDGDTRRYAEDESVRRAVSHIVGDVYGKSVGAETYFAKQLYGYDQGVIDKFTGAVSGAESSGSDIYLTVDAALSQYIYGNMDYDGAVVLMNYQTGQVLASVSVPTFDPSTIGDEGDDEGSKYFNRAMQGKYPPGSTMKVVTTAAALQSGMTDLEIDCTGEKIIEGQRITCPKEGGHGHVNLHDAFTRSCNIYYAELSVQLGQAGLLGTANSFGFNTDFNFSDFRLGKSNFEVSGNKGDQAWAGIGQYKDTVTPMHNALIAAGIANDGTVMQPHTLLDVVHGGNSSYTYAPSVYKQFTTSGTAQIVKQYMRDTVNGGTATSAQVGGVQVCGKTGTAEYYDAEAGGNKNHSWFIGFVEDSSHPLAIAVLQEGAGFGSAVATPLAGQVLAKAIEMGY
jgi:peptidoglycan glycosyltransferase